MSGTRKRTKTKEEGWEKDDITKSKRSRLELEDTLCRRLMTALCSCVAEENRSNRQFQQVKTVLQQLKQNGLKPNSLVQIHPKEADGHVRTCPFCLSKKDQSEECQGRGRSCTGLHAAILLNNLALCKLLVSHRADINAVDSNGYRPLMYAAGKGYTQDVMEWLLASKSKLKKWTMSNKDGVSFTAMAFALENNCLGNARLLFSSQFCRVEDLCTTLETPLLFAMTLGNPEVVRFLVEEMKAQVKVIDRLGYGPLHKAAYNQDIACVRLLINAGADPFEMAGGWPRRSQAKVYHHYRRQFPSEELDKGGTPLHFCLCGKKDRSVLETMNLFMKERGYREFFDKHSDNLLSCALQHMDMEVMEVFFKNIHDVEFMSDENPYKIVLDLQTQNDFEAKFQVSVFERMFNLQKPLSLENILLRVVLKSNFQLLNFLSHKVDLPNYELKPSLLSLVVGLSRNGTRRIPERDKYKIIQQYLSLNPCIDEIDELGSRMTALCGACREGNRDMAKLLLQMGADPLKMYVGNRQRKSKLYPLYCCLSYSWNNLGYPFASRKEILDMMLLLVQYGGGACPLPLDQYNFSRAADRLKEEELPTLRLLHVSGALTVRHMQKLLDNSPKNNSVKRYLTSAVKTPLSLSDLCRQVIIRNPPAVLRGGPNRVDTVMSYPDLLSPLRRYLVFKRRDFHTKEVVDDLDQFIKYFEN